MGHQVGQKERPTRGSRAFVPKVRAKRIYPRIKNWPHSDEPKLLGFAAYKAGMTQISFVDNSPHSPTKGEVISIPVTILDSPKMKIAAIRLYKKDARGFKKVLTEIWTEKLDKELKKKITPPKKEKKIEEQISKVKLDEVIEVTVLVYTLPKGRANKKKPEIFEIGIGGKDVSSKFEYAKSILGNEISASDVLKPGDQVDIIAVTKGKGFQGTIKRFGVKLESKKTDRKRRGVASIGPDVPRKVRWTIPMPGQMGFHNRYDYNKWIIGIGNEGIAPKGGFQNYGIIKGDYIIVKGSIPGSSKRPVRMRFAINPKSSVPSQAPDIIQIDGVKK